jgi:hypothetical protein
MMNTTAQQMLRRTTLIITTMAMMGAGSAMGQNGSIGLGLGAFVANPDGTFSVSSQFNLPLIRFDAVSVSGRVNADLIIGGSKSDLNLLISPLLNYTLNPLVITPITLYVGPVVRMFTQDVFSEARMTTWSLLGGVAGASVSVLGFVEPYAETTFSLNPGVWSFHGGVRFAF